MNALPLSLLRFCIEHSDDPSQIANVDISRFDRDPKDYEWLMAALGDLETDSTKAMRLVEKIQTGLSDNDLEAALEALQYLVEDIDVANTLSKKKVLHVLVDLLPHDFTKVRYWSSWIVASLAQNCHHLFQEQMLVDIINHLLTLMPQEKDNQTISKQLYALSSMLSEDSNLNKIFLERSGIELVVSLMLNEEAGINSKAVWLLSKVFGFSSEARNIAKETDFLKNIETISANSEAPSELKNKCKIALSNFEKESDNSTPEPAVTRIAVNQAGATILALGPASLNNNPN
eukprot:TRINITY_DN4091_c0_g1_i1.p1 TRINITY_DN4091_c0_g1~~TRINITY_DN4091_c0_g1_i1.p1  ORF type:complete len:289 (+),score=69.69 TRINITY_DN4091_c0_g1_i1:60-926(+)